MLDQLVLPQNDLDETFTDSVALARGSFPIGWTEPHAVFLPFFVAVMQFFFFFYCDTHLIWCFSMTSHSSAVSIVNLEI